MLSINALQDVISALKKEEGFEGKPYKDSLNILTIGYGRNLVDNGITEEEASFLLGNDINKCIFSVQKTFSFYERLDEGRRAFLVLMCFQLGLTKMLKFKNTLGLISQAKYKEASKELLKSAWAKQTPLRVERMSKLLETGDLKNYYFFNNADLAPSK